MPATKKELILAALVTLSLPVLAEIGLRAARVAFEPQLYTADRQMGWSLRPGAEGVVVGETRQYVQINDHGFRDVPRSYEKPAKTVRVAVLGNSWTEALQVPRENTYCSVLERRLAGLPCFSGRRVEVLNFGVSGYSTAQELLLLRQEVWKYQPDIVIVAFYSARDVANNVRQFNNAADPEQSPYFVYRGDRLVLDSSFQALPAVQPRQIQLQKIRCIVNEHIRVLQAVNTLVRYGRAQVAMAAIKERAAVAGVDSLEHAVYVPPSRPTLEEAWHVTEGLLLAIRDESRAHGAQFRIVTLANRPQVIPDLEKRTAFMRSLGVTDLSYADQRINALGAREGIPVTNLAPALAAYAESHREFLNGFNATNLGGGHWNETGHRLAAETLAANLCDSREQSTLADTAAGSPPNATTTLQETTNR
jgi:hypothetical protein